MDKQREKEMYEALNDWHERENQIDVENKRLLEENIKPNLSKLGYEDLLELLEESEHTFDYKIVDKPVGKYQEEDVYGGLKGCWVNQTTNGGYAGDEFAGTVCVKLNNNKYFKFNYSM